MHDLTTSENAIKYLACNKIVKPDCKNVVIEFKFDDRVAITSDGVTRKIESKAQRVALLAFKSLVGINIERCRSISIIIDDGGVPIVNISFVGETKHISYAAMVVCDLCH